MPHDYPTLVILGIGAAILLWLIFSVMKKLFGLALIAALVFGGYMLWTNPDLQQRALDLIGIG
ncbi:ABC-type bacteriocin/lantibiotic exporter with double-glycine peptidase domain [Devosia subaequoris]|uniref:ABC-type bacteriocin/lantibiotic exporter with double-glycine peptidase domain n=1 Tax=Devosia subaequoris TaxID=395930 RepID=A0A7W6NB49_9HYPH|nr:hypothetical protein [Devosia subaequoris]MBB4051568.1 ABC-type bacteriocin/lantibiotic exporter with double-glycine peptidase domain [Devosia subaequoris]MCP1209160.1 hypothetical protein [Devosia subaequoris]